MAFFRKGINLIASNRPVGEQSSLFRFDLAQKIATRGRRPNAAENRGAPSRIADSTFDLQAFGRENYEQQSDSQLAKSLRKHREALELHLKKIANPKKYAADWNERDERQKQGLIRWWEKEVKNLNNQVGYIVEEQERRKQR